MERSVHGRSRNVASGIVHDSGSESFHQYREGRAQCERIVIEHVYAVSDYRAVFGYWLAIEENVDAVRSWIRKSDWTAWRWHAWRTSSRIRRSDTAAAVTYSIADRTPVEASCITRFSERHVDDAVSTERVETPSASTAPSWRTIKRIELTDSWSLIVHATSGNRCRVDGSDIVVTCSGKSTGRIGSVNHLASVSTVQRVVDIGSDEIRIRFTRVRFGKDSANVRDDDASEIVTRSLPPTATWRRWNDESAYDDEGGIGVVVSKVICGIFVRIDNRCRILKK